MFRRPPKEVLNYISYHQQAQMTSDIAGARGAYMGKITVCKVLCFYFYLGENQRLHISDPLELKWKLKTDSYREWHDCSQVRLRHRVQLHVADDGFSWLILFLVYSLQRRDYAKTGFPKLLDGFSLAFWALRIWSSVCLLQKNPQLKFDLLIRSAGMGARSILSN